MAHAAAEEIRQLSPATQAWFTYFATSPATAPYRPNKDEVCLHMTLLDAPRDAWSVLRRRLLPGNLPPPSAGVFLPRDRLTWRKRLRHRLAWLAYSSGRVCHHATALPRVAVSGSRWWWRSNPLGEQFWLFLSSAVLFNFALFVFVLLYNLYLSGLGFREDSLGLVNGANRIGSLAGTLPAAFVAQRLGLRRALLATIGATALMELLRAVLVSPASAAALGFASGFVFALWAVIFSPVIVAAVDEKRRPAAFSVYTATMVGIGIAGNWIGGLLPGWLHGTRPVLVLSAALSAVALWPAIKLRLSEHASETPRASAVSGFVPRGFLLRYLVAIAVWNLATGAFNPFANVYFERLLFPVERIGAVFSFSQAAQVAAVLAAPLVFRKCGLTTGISWMMLATAAALCALAGQASGFATALVYSAYMSFQWMSEPGLNTLLMNRVEAAERSRASALNYLVAFGAQALAAFAGGALMARFGYTAVLAGAAAVAAAAAGLFRVLPAMPHIAPRLPRLRAAETGNVRQ
ncbi:MAG: MFS transporter [Acidobacteriia bacterium]|nr:MFS transporter [Terriglobia bacterium]